MTTPALRSGVRISELAYDVLWEVYARREKHPALWCDSPGATWRERFTYGRRVVAELQELGLARGDEPDPALRSAFALIAEPRSELYGWYQASAEERTLSVLAVASGRDALVAWFGDGYLTLGPCRPAELPAAISVGLPRRSALRMREEPLSVPLEAVDGDGLEEPSQITEAVHPTDRHTLATEDARRIVALPRVGVGEFFAAKRDPVGGRRRCTFPMNYVDTPSGRYLTKRETGPARTVQLRISTGDNRNLADQLGRLLSDT